MTNANDFTPPNPYAEPVRQMRAAMQREAQQRATPESRFAAQYAAQRARDLADESRDHFRTASAAYRARVTPEELQRYAPPNAYEAGIKALQAQERSQ